ncbi:MAG: flagellar filament capping protein FliD [Pseudomonadales bacterium]|nr:flagellar filament capping protein FliD [Pseudomonadales bacterium]MCP5331379.1 flagellar filament capping protein FliD [Pseudomonadales bacterium]MCP5344388.1 flagellar filament capping protein FliD [Pseudomonadales bacterium]
MASIQSLGVGSGLLTSELVEQIIEAERAPVQARLDNKQTVAEAKISAYGEITSALSSFDSSLSALRLPSTFNASTVSSSNEAGVTATASSLAVAGSYTVNVAQLAQAHSIASHAYAEVTDTVGTGVLNFRFGTTTYGVGNSYDSFTLNPDANSKSIAITSSNNTLAGIRDAVNKANFGVQASIVDDGTGYRLVFTAKESGAKNSIEIVATGTDGLKALNYNASSQNATLAASTTSGTLDLSAGAGLDSSSLAFSLRYQGVDMDVVVPANVAIADTDGVLAAVQSALNTQLLAKGFSAGDVLAAADGDRLYFASADTGFDQALQVLTDGASASLSGGSALSDGFDFSANNASFSIAVDGGVAQAITLNTASASRQETIDLVNAALVTAGLDSDVVASLNENNELLFTRVTPGAAGSLAISALDVSGSAATAELGLSVADVSGLDGFGLDDAQGQVKGSERLGETITAQNALFSVNGLSVSRSSNLVTGVIPGTTLNLKGVTAGPVTLSVARDASVISDKLQGFVDNYNALKALADDLTAFDTSAGDKGQGSLLTGDSTLRLAMAEINRLLRTTVTGLTGSVRSLAEIGITTDKDANYQLKFDPATFADKFASNASDILGLFATAGSTSDSLLTYSSATSNTQPGTYDVNITRLATTGTFSGQQVATLANGNIVIDDNNDEFTVLLNGVSADISLVQGSYSTAADLAEHIQTRINSNADLLNNNFRVAVAYNADETRFDIASNTYGSNSGIGFLEVEPGMANLLGLTTPYQGDALGNYLSGLSTPTGSSAENFDTALTLDAETSFVLTVNGISSELLTMPGSSGTPVDYDKPADLISAMESLINGDPAFAPAAAKSGVGDVLTAGQDFSSANLAVSISLDGGSTSTQVIIDGDSSSVSFGGETPGSIENTLAAVQDAIDATALNGLVLARLDDSQQIYFETVATGSASQIQIAEDGAPAILAGSGAVNAGGFDFAANNASFDIDIDGVGAVPVLIDTATVSAADTLLKVQNALAAAGVDDRIAASLDGSDQLVLSYTSGTGAGTQIELSNANANATTALGLSSQLVNGLDGFSLTDTNNTGDDGVPVTVSYEYDAEAEQGRLVFSTQELADLISFSSVSTTAGNKLGMVSGFNPRITSVDGVNVAGTINGVEADGVGQTLLASGGNVAAMPGFYLNAAHGNLANSTSSDTFRVTVDGVQSNAVTLGTLSNTAPTAVASAMQSAINNSPALLAAGVSVKVEYDSTTGGFGIISNSTGAASSVQISALGGNAASIFGFATGMGAHGRAGSNASGELDVAAGLRIVVNGGALGSRGTVSYIKGVAEELSVLMDTYLGASGLFTTRTDTLNAELESISEQRTALNERIARSEARLRASFLANDKIINQLNTTADYLSSQLQALEALASNTVQQKQ